MPLQYQTNGNLISGIFEITWVEFVKEYGYNKQRVKLISGLERAINELKDVGCKTIYIDGSFVSKKTIPNDFDACWEPAGINFSAMAAKYPVLMEFMPSTANQKKIYGGELFPSPSMLSFFQKDRDGFPKGIIKLNL